MAQQAMQMLKAVVEELEKQEAASPGSTDKSGAQELRKLLDEAQRRGPEAAFGDPKNRGLTEMLLKSLPAATNGQGAGGVASP